MNFAKIELLRMTNVQAFHGYKLSRSKNRKTWKVSLRKHIRRYAKAKPQVGEIEKL